MLAQWGGTGMPVVRTVRGGATGDVLAAGRGSNPQVSQGEGVIRLFEHVLARLGATGQCGIFAGIRDATAEGEFKVFGNSATGGASGKDQVGGNGQTTAGAGVASGKDQAGGIYVEFGNVVIDNNSDVKTTRSSPSLAAWRLGRCRPGRRRLCQDRRRRRRLLFPCRLQQGTGVVNGL
jgi:hypothetical protein